MSQGLAKPRDGASFRAVTGDSVANPGRPWPESVASVCKRWVQSLPGVEYPETAYPAEVENRLAGAKTLSPLYGAIAIGCGQRRLLPTFLRPGIGRKGHNHA